MIRIESYNREKKDLWDKFIVNSKNGTFLFLRDYMDYHSDRFKDNSLMFFKKNKLFAVMPANINDNKLVSHGGLSFGGIISNYEVKTPLMLEIFQCIKNYMKKKDIHNLTYKTIPHIYHKIPSEEDIYALFINKANLTRRDVSSTIFLKDKITFSKGKKWCIKKGIKNGLKVKKSNDFKSFIKIAEKNLIIKYDIKPTHTAKEMDFLSKKFPNNIKLFTAEICKDILAGVIIYETENVAHTQYIAATNEGKMLYATDVILDFLIRDYYSGKRFFDFGISTEKNGYYLNKGLNLFKENFGARATVQDFYEIKNI